MKFVVLCCLYAASLPILYLLVAALLAVAPLVDRLNLLRRFPKTKDTDDSLVRTALLFVMPIAVLLHLAMAYVEYEALLSDEARAHRTAGHASVVPVPFPIDADAYLAKDVTAAASEPIHANAPSDRPSHEQLGEIYAMRFVLLSLALNGAYLFFFIVREWVDFFFGYKIGVGLLQRFSVGADGSALSKLSGIIGAGNSLKASYARLDEETKGSEAETTRRARALQQLQRYEAPRLPASLPPAPRLRRERTASDEERRSWPTPATVEEPYLAAPTPALGSGPGPSAAPPAAAPPAAPAAAPPAARAERQYVPPPPSPRVTAMEDAMALPRLPVPVSRSADSLPISPQQ